MGSMNERVPDSSGLPLRAMVMVLLFLGVIFLLLGWQALDSSGKSDDDASPVTTVSATAPASSTSAKPAAANEPDVRVYNISSREGIAKSTADELKAAGFKVTEVTNLAVSDVSATTVYYGETTARRPPRRPWARSWERRWKNASRHFPTSRPASSFW